MSYFDRDAGPITDYISIEEIHEELQAEHAAALDEIERLRAALEIAIDAQRCECSTDDACRFARERDEARAEVERLREGIRAIVGSLEDYDFAYCNAVAGTWHIDLVKKPRLWCADKLRALLEGEK